MPVVCDLIGVSKAQVYRLAREGKLEMVRLGGRTSITSASVQRHLREAMENRRRHRRCRRSWCAASATASSAQTLRGHDAMRVTMTRYATVAMITDWLKDRTPRTTNAIAADDSAAFRRSARHAATARPEPRSPASRRRNSVHC